MRPGEKLPHELLWDEDGHASEEVVSALADVEDSIVPENVIQHVNSCDECTRRIGEAALLSIEIEERLQRDSAVSEVALSRAAPVPLVAIAAALCIAFVGVMPTLVTIPAKLVQFYRALVLMLPHLARSVAALAGAGIHGYGYLAMLLMVGSVVILILAGLGVARVMPRISSEGGL